MTLRSLLLVLLVCLPALSQPRNDDLHRLFDEYFEDFLREHPEVATSMGRAEHNARWRDWSRAARDAWAGRLARYLERLDAFDSAGLNSQDRLSWRLLRQDLRTRLEGLPYEAYLTRLVQLGGLHTNVLLTLREMPARSEADYENILARLSGVPGYVEQNISTLREAMEAGVVQPKLVIDLIVGQLARQAAPAPEVSPLLAAFRQFPAGIPERRREALAALAEQGYENAFRPAWQRLREFLADEYARAARSTLAVTGLSDGDSIYRFFIRLHASLPLSADEIHETGLREVARIDRDMERVARESGFNGTSAEYERHLRTDPKYLFASKEAMLAHHRDLAMRVFPELPNLFKRLPRHAFGIRAIPPDRERESASNYNPPAADGSRAGWFNLNAYQPQKQSRFDKPSLVLHETHPGHHMQLATQRELEGLPEFRKMYRSTAYIEGWALYAETLGEELGVYDDPPSRFGALEGERFRARRLVVDTGLHAKGWSRQRAVDYLGDESEVDRYIAWPGQALAYKIGQMKILELKAAACEAYGAAFDIRDFHDVVLRNGSMPLEILEEQVGKYIDLASPGPSSGCPEGNGVRAP